MKLKHILIEAGENLDTIVKIDSMPEYRVTNPTEQEKAEAQDNKKASLPPEVTDNPKDEKKADSAVSAAKDLVIKLLDDIKEYLKSV